jgi:glucokinase
MPPPKSITPSVQALGVDIGRTKISVGLVDGAGDLREKIVVPAPRHGDNDAVIDIVDEVGRKILDQFPTVRALGVGTPEVVEWPSGVTIHPDGREDFPLRPRLEAALGLPTVVDSDANVAAWAEFRHGAAAGSRNAVLVTVGTGIGGGIIVNGALYRGARGFAGEIGHMVMDPGGEACQCGNSGCWEAVASGTALGRDGRQAASDDPFGLMARLAGDPSLVTGETVAQAARQADATALELVQRMGCWLGAGIASMVLIFDPDVVVVGGGLVENGALLLEPAREQALRNLLVRAKTSPPIRPARFGTDAGVIGAGLLALDTMTETNVPLSARAELVGGGVNGRFS